MHEFYQCMTAAQCSTSTRGPGGLFVYLLRAIKRLSSRPRNLPRQSLQAAGPALGVTLALTLVAEAFVKQKHVRRTAAISEFQGDLRLLHVGLRRFPSPGEADRVREVDLAVLTADDVRV